MRVNLLKEGEKLTDFGWGIARKKPIEIHYRKPIPNTMGPSAKAGDLQTADLIPVERVFTREGELFAWPERDYIIKGVRGEIYPIGIDIFNETYEVIEEPQSFDTSARDKDG